MVDFNYPDIGYLVLCAYVSSVQFKQPQLGSVCTKKHMTLDVTILMQVYMRTVAATEI